MIRTIIYILSVVTAALALTQRSNVPQGKYPSQVSLQQIGTWHRCSGTILNEKWVLTSAYCLVYEEPRLWFVYAGDVNLEGNGQTHEVAQFIVHEEYDNGFNVYDLNNVGLVQVVNPFIFSENVQPVTLPSQDFNTPGGTLATLVAWGNGGTQLLQEMETSTVDDVNCVLRCGEDITYPSNLCAEVPPTANSCFGDYGGGGPLFANGVQVGIFSWAPSAHQCSVPTCFYADVSNYIDWINSKIN